MCLLFDVVVWVGRLCVVVGDGYVFVCKVGWVWFGVWGVVRWVGDWLFFE